MNAPSLRSRAARGGAITLGAQVVRAAVLLVGVIILARLIDPDDFGLMAMVLAITGIAEIFRDFGLSMAALQAKDLTQAQKSNLFWLNAGIGLALAAIVFALAWPIAAFYGEPDLIPVVQITSSVYLLGGLTAQFRIAINRALRFGALAVVDIVPPLLGLGGAILVAALGNGLTALVVQQVVLAAGTLVLSVALAKWWPGLPKRTPGMRPLLSFGVSWSATQLLTYLTRNVDSIAIGRVWGPVQLGLYDRAFQLSVAPINQINVPMSRVAIPVLSRVTDDRGKFLGALREAQLVATYVTASLLLLVAGLSVPLVTLLLGQEWAAAGVILGVLAIGSVFRAIQQVSYWMFMSQGLAGSQLKLFLVGQPAIVICLLAGLPWGPVGVAAGAAVGYAGFWIASLLWAGRVSRLDVRPLALDALRIVATVGLPVGLLGLLVSIFVPLAPIWVVLIGIAGTLAWFAIVWVAIPFVRRDAALLSRFARMALGGRA